MNRKRQIAIFVLLEELDRVHEEMIEDAVAVSDMQQAKEIISYVIEKSKQNP